MLKLKQNEIPSGNIDGVNKTFRAQNIIGTIQSIYVDGVRINEGEYTVNIIDLILDVAPTTSILINYLFRELSSLRGSGEVTLGTLKTNFYRKIGRVNPDGTVPQNINKIYPEDYVREELRKSIKRIGNTSPSNDKFQEYSFKSKNGYIVTDNTNENIMTFNEKVFSEIDGVFIIEKGIMYEYYDLIGDSFKTADVDLSEIDDKIVVGFRIPYGVQKIESVRVGGVKFEYEDERDWNIWKKNKYTIVRDYQGNEYIFTPYMDEAKVFNIKYTPDLGGFIDDEDIIDVPYEYGDLFVYDVAYKMLRDKDDDRWQGMKSEVGNGMREGLLYEYRKYLTSLRRGDRPKIGIAKTFKK